MRDDWRRSEGDGEAQRDSSRRRDRDWAEAERDERPAERLPESLGWGRGNGRKGGKRTRERGRGKWICGLGGKNGMQRRERRMKESGCGAVGSEFLSGHWVRGELVPSRTPATRCPCYTLFPKDTHQTCALVRGLELTPQRLEARGTGSQGHILLGRTGVKEATSEGRGGPADLGVGQLWVEKREASSLVG
ncbi:uncharacterized protein LOC117083206 [Trachypithecus francoisi]|uniref:uncharacterized protein LOC117083206 n=1 Tax=Trachypithecus francoisi TaxID=54180 RepID=UPI00141BEE09|nr:uncharacterized protein LOC117083206 [Trachypithecus francoisi]